MNKTQLTEKQLRDKFKKGLEEIKLWKAQQTK